MRRALFGTERALWSLSECGLGLGCLCVYDIADIVCDVAPFVVRRGQEQEKERGERQREI